MKFKRIMSLVIMTALFAVLLAVPSFAAVTAGTVTKLGTADEPVAFQTDDFEAAITGAATGATLVSLQIVSIPDTATEGELKLATPNTSVAIDDVIPADDIDDLVFEPIADLNAAVTFNFTAIVGTETSDEGTVRLNYEHKTPSAAAQTVKVKKNEAKEITLTGSDPDSRPLTYTITDQPAKGMLALKAGSKNVFTYTPANNATGADTFQFTVSNGVEASAKATVTIDITDEIEPLKYADLYHNGAATHWSYTSAGSLAELGLVVGMKLHGAHYYFNPDEFITRGEFTMWLNAVMEIALSDKATSEFADVTLPHMIEQFNAAKEQHFVSGIMDKNVLKFFPMENLNRAQAIQMIDNALKGATNTTVTLTFADKNTIPTWAANAVKNLVGLKIVQGDNHNKLRPLDSVRRSEAAELLFKLYKERKLREAD